jgi:hypothetical protein
MIAGCLYDPAILVIQLDHVGTRKFILVDSKRMFHNKIWICSMIVS